MPPQVTLSGGSLDRPQSFRCVPRGNYPGQYYVGLGRLPEGRYSLRVAGIDKNDLSGVAAFDVRGNLAERLDVCAQPNVMKLIADESGGAVAGNGRSAAAGATVRSASQPHPARAHGADDGLGSLVGVAGRVCDLGRRMGAAAAVGIGVRVYGATGVPPACGDAGGTPALSGQWITNHDFPRHTTSSRSTPAAGHRHGGRGGLGIGRGDDPAAARRVAGPALGVSAGVADRHVLGGGDRRRGAARRAGGRDRARRPRRGRRPAARSRRAASAAGSSPAGNWRRKDGASACLASAQPGIDRSAWRTSPWPTPPRPPGKFRWARLRRCGRWAARSARSFLLWAVVARAGRLPAGPGADAMEPLLASVRRRAAVLAERVQGHARATSAVLYGSELEIRAEVIGSPVEQLELVLESANGQEPPLPMFPEPDGVWRAVLAKVVEPTDYYVRAYRARSEKYHLGIITVPLIEDARLRIEPPAYANRAAYEGPLPKEGVSGLPGTKVQIFAPQQPAAARRNDRRVVRTSRRCSRQAATTPAPQAASRRCLPMKPDRAGQPGGRRAVRDRRRREVRMPRDRRGRGRSRSRRSRAT